MARTDMIRFGEAAKIALLMLLMLAVAAAAGIAAFSLCEALFGAV